LSRIALFERLAHCKRGGLCYMRRHRCFGSIPR
jgi:hypothetical protein